MTEGIFVCRKPADSVARFPGSPATHRAVTFAVPGNRDIGRPGFRVRIPQPVPWGCRAPIPQPVSWGCRVPLLQPVSWETPD